MLLLGGVLSRSHIEEPIPPPAAFIPPAIVCPPPQLPVPALHSVLSGLWDPCLALDVHPLLVIFIGNNFSLRAFYFVHNALVEHKFLFVFETVSLCRLLASAGIKGMSLNSLMVLSLMGF